MGSVIVLSLLIAGTFVVLCYIFNESRIELDVPTIAAMEARARAVEPEREVERRTEGGRRTAETYSTGEADHTAGADAEEVEVPPAMTATGYEYREMLEEGGHNYVLPQWMVNFFSSSDVCHTLDPGDNVILVARLDDAKNAESIVDISADCDMSTQTFALKLCFGEGAVAETLKTKFYLFERGDLFELNRLVRQHDLRIDILTRAADYTLEYACSIRPRLPQNLLTQLKNVLAKIPT